MRCVRIFPSFISGASYGSGGVSVFINAKVDDIRVGRRKTVFLSSSRGKVTGHSALWITNQFLPFRWVIGS